MSYPRTVVTTKDILFSSSSVFARQHSMSIKTNTSKKKNSRHADNKPNNADILKMTKSISSGKSLIQSNMVFFAVCVDLFSACNLMKKSEKSTGTLMKIRVMGDYELSKQCLKTIDGL